MADSTGKENKICFVIAPIGEQDSSIRKHSDQMLRHVIKPAVELFGYSPLRADQLPKPGMITNQIIQHIKNDSLVIADLTGKNPNVYYELAVRHAISKPFVQLIKAGETIPFDLHGMRTVEVDLNDPDKLEQAREDIANQIESIEKDPNVIESPISIAVQLESLLQSGKPEVRTLGEILTALSDIRIELAGVRSAMNAPHSGGWLNWLLEQGEIETVRRLLDEHSSAPGGAPGVARGAPGGPVQDESYGERPWTPPARESGTSGSAST